MLTDPAKYFDRAVARCLAAPAPPATASRSVLPGGCVLYRLPLNGSRDVPASSRRSSSAVNGMDSRGILAGNRCAASQNENRAAIRREGRAERDR